MKTIGIHKIGSFVLIVCLCCSGSRAFSQHQPASDAVIQDQANFRFVHHGILANLIPGRYVMTATRFSFFPSRSWPSLDTLQTLTRYYANGRKEIQGWWCAGRAFNDWTEWYEDGQVKLEAHYEPWPIVEPPYRMSLPIGEWRYYKPNGDLEKIEVYDDGKLKETRAK